MSLTVKKFLIGTIAGVPAGILMYIATGSNLANFATSFLVSLIIMAQIKE